MFSFYTMREYLTLALRSCPFVLVLYLLAFRGLLQPPPSPLASCCSTSAFRPPISALHSSLAGFHFPTFTLDSSSFAHQPSPFALRPLYSRLHPPILDLDLEPFTLHPLLPTFALRSPTFLLSPPASDLRPRPRTLHSSSFATDLHSSPLALRSPQNSNDSQNTSHANNLTL